MSVKLEVPCVGATTGKGETKIALELELNGVAGNAADFPRELVLQADADSIVCGGGGKGGKEASVVEWGVKLKKITRHT